MKSLFAALLPLILLILLGCDQGYRIEVGPSDNNSKTTFPDEKKDNPNMNPSNQTEEDLISEFKKDAEEIGRLKCLERQARESGNNEEHKRIEADKIEFDDNFKQRVRTKYSKFMGKPEFDEIFRKFQDIGRLRAGCRD